MTTSLFDTEVVSFLWKNHPYAAKYLPFTEGITKAMSFASVGELYEDGIRSNWDRKAFETLDELLRHYQIMKINSAVCRTWGWIRGQRRVQPIGVNDAWIAATAITFDLPLVTHNVRDFSGIQGLRILTAQ